MGQSKSTGNSYSKKSSMYELKITKPKHQIIKKRNHEKTETEVLLRVKPIKGLIFCRSQI